MLEISASCVPCKTLQQLIVRSSDPSTGRGRKQITTRSSLDSHQLPRQSTLRRKMLKSSPCLLRRRPQDPPLPPKPQCQLSQCTRTQPTRFMQMRRKFRRVDHRPLLPTILLCHRQPGEGRRRGINLIEKCQERTGWGIKTMLMGRKAWRAN